MPLRGRRGGSVRTTRDDLLATSPGLPSGSAALPCDDMLVSSEDKYDKTTSAEAFAIIFIVLIVVGSCVACSVCIFMSRRKQSDAHRRK